MKKHYPYGPSSSSRWLGCPGSVPLCTGLPESLPGYAAAEGTRAHDYIEAVLRQTAGKQDLRQAKEER